MPRAVVSRWMVYILALSGLGPSMLWAEKPSVTAFHPAGGQAGQTVDVDVLGKLGTKPVELWSDHGALSAKLTEDGKRFQVNIAPDAPNGIHWLRVWNAEGASDLRPFVVGPFPEVQETEPNQTLSTAQTVESAGVVVNGKLEKTNDVDTYRFALKQGQTVVADVLANEVLGSPMDAVLQITSAEGFVLAQEDDSPKLDPRLAFTAPADGDYAVRLFAFPDVATSSIRFAGGANFIYRLTLTTGPYGHHPTPLALEKNVPTPVNWVGWNLSTEPVPLEVKAADAEQAASSVPMPSVLPRRISLVEHSSLVELPLKEGDPPQLLETPVSLTGCIAQPDEIDRYQFAAKKGEALTVRVESANLGFPLDPVLEIRDAAGKVLNSADDKSRGESDVELSWKAPADGTYQLHLSDRYQHGGLHYAYLLTLESPRPDFRLSLGKPDIYVLAQGKPLEIPVTINRQSGFNEEIRLEVAGLPEGFTAEPVKVEPKSNAKSVKIKIVPAGKTPFHGPIWIRGKSGEMEKTAEVSAAATSAKAQHVWLTYAPK